MHELGVVSNVLDIVVERAEELGIARVSAVHVILGEDAGVTEDSFLFHWELAARGTVAETAEVTVEHQARGGVRLAWIDVERAEDSTSRDAADVAVASVTEPEEPHEH